MSEDLCPLCGAKWPRYAYACRECDLHGMHVEYIVDLKSTVKEMASLLRRCIDMDEFGCGHTYLEVEKLLEKSKDLLT